MRFRVSGTLEEKFKVNVQAGKFSLIIDEPPELGGTGKGPNPIEVLLSSLISCFMIATSFHAARRRIRVKRLEVEAVGELDIRGFAGEAEVRPGLASVELRATIESDEPEEKVRELVKFVEEHCPVMDTLTRGAKVSTVVTVKPSTR